MMHPLVEEAMKKAAIAWVAVGGRPPRGVWCHAAEDALWLVSGPGEQQVPGLAWADEALVTLRGDHGGRIVTWPASVTRVDPRGEEWERVVPQLAGKRLNAACDAASLMERWASECVVHRLTPAGDPVEAGTTLPAGSLAEPVRDSPARRPTRAPFRLHRVRRRR